MRKLLVILGLLALLVGCGDNSNPVDGGGPSTSPTAVDTFSARIVETYSNIEDGDTIWVTLIDDSLDSIRMVMVDGTLEGLDSTTFCEEAEKENTVNCWLDTSTNSGDVVETSSSSSSGESTDPSSSSITNPPSSEGISSSSSSISLVDFIPMVESDLGNYFYLVDSAFADSVFQGESCDDSGGGTETCKFGWGYIYTHDETPTSVFVFRDDDTLKDFSKVGLESLYNLVSDSYIHMDSVCGFSSFDALVTYRLQEEDLGGCKVNDRVTEETYCRDDTNYFDNDLLPYNVDPSCVAIDIYGANTLFTDPNLLVKVPYLLAIFDIEYNSHLDSILDETDSYRRLVFHEAILWIMRYAEAIST